MSAQAPRFVVCVGGPRDGYWYDGKFWLQCVSAAKFNNETATEGRTLGYRVTEELEAHPRMPDVMGNIARWTGGKR